ncbi:hypothetical protein HYALB_00007251 [Hymenoscyphus albidus]|uniref:Heterokaryon incompatibility domain-containing protein n=1 Tax=Hymenoscyphus albidus TaxID=595503 RepID=A0A9N9LD40_9HELO|nr:hypothetical protein HYALB_00007251 [Hymenoscyphus albidus]
MWGLDEVSLLDVCILDVSPLESQDTSVYVMERFAKITKCCRQAQVDEIQWVWIDTCCVDRSNREEMNKACNLAYKWLEEAVVCYAYLSDVPGSVTGSFTDGQTGIRNSRYFTRKWTLQDLVAPRVVKFFAKNWRILGTRSSLNHLISEVTGISPAVLLGEKNPKQCHVSERMAWASNRKTTKVEDEAYSMMGLFDINMPILYGEGSRAFRRLQDEIRKTHYSSVLDTARTGMRLLDTRSEPLQIRSFFGSDSPEYAILSHTWGSADDEVSFSDVCQGKAEGKRLYSKVRKSCDLAASHGFEYIWIDTCCIDKSSSAELQEAICSVYRWYKNARICYVHLEDFLAPTSSCEKPSLWNSRWFTRGWTLQELIAPTFVELYDRNWTEIGTNLSLCEHISDITDISPAVLRGSDPTKGSIAERISWAASRSTTRVEDAAYSLLGLFDVFIPMYWVERVLGTEGHGELIAL